MKPYDSLATISQAAQQMTEHIEQLRAGGLLLPEFAEIRKFAVRQIRAEVSHAAALNLAGRELEDASTTEKERMEREERLKR